MLVLPIIALFVALGLGVWVVLEQADERATIRGSLRQLQGYELDNARDRELAEPVRERVILPIVTRLVGVGKVFTPADYVAKVRHRLTVAGKPTQEQLDRFLAVRVITIALIPVWFFVSLFVLHLGRRNGFLVFALLALASVLGPDAILNRRMAERQHLIQIKLPDILDLLTISVEAGLGFEQALDRTVGAVPGPLSEEFARMLGEVRAGARRADAMRALDERTDVSEVRSFVLAILQADTFGVSIGRVLRSQADEMRVRRRQLAQERAMKAPVKMLIPMVFCVFPALFVVVIGPAVLSFIHGFK
ncbi:MAG: type II secretion system F family protein [Actinobacteria bacterium]|nr:type II secretion system F family protein [Actinomycetota bacterium]MBV8959101.1 type II secretion system F family protein [Actinomycetota bacterium]MBV9664446.1 type II secretion system F family protein [Actinomycetota bacterium]MBV9933314.1 type II secretion system F family protein [Actinomycetota bacterium]